MHAAGVKRGLAAAARAMNFYWPLKMTESSGLRRERPKDGRPPTNLIHSPCTGSELGEVGDEAD